MDYYWKATLNNGSEIDQMKDGQDQTFKPVIENKEKIIEFKLISTDGKNREYIVNLKTGEFTFNGVKIKMDKFDWSNASKVEPIYWRRNKVILLGAINRPIPIGYIIGWQAIFDNKNEQKQFIISPEGEISYLEKI